MTTESTKLYNRAASIAKRFSCSKDFVFYCLNNSTTCCIIRGGVRYKTEVNKHPECEEARRDIVEKYGVRLGKIPDRCRYLLPKHRQ